MVTSRATVALPVVSLALEQSIIEVSTLPQDAARADGAKIAVASATLLNSAKSAIPPRFPRLARVILMLIILQGQGDFAGIFCYT